MVRLGASHSLGIVIGPYDRLFKSVVDRSRMSLLMTDGSRRTRLVRIILIPGPAFSEWNGYRTSFFPRESSCKLMASVL